MWERDRTEPGRDRVRQISEVLEVDLADLEGFTTEASTRLQADELEPSFAHDLALTVIGAYRTLEQGLFSSIGFIEVVDPGVLIAPALVPPVDQNEPAKDQNVELLVDRFERLVQFVRAQNFNG